MFHGRLDQSGAGNTITIMQHRAFDHIFLRIQGLDRWWQSG